MRTLLLITLLLLPACSLTARPPAPSEGTVTPTPVNAPDLTGEWLVKPNSGAFNEIWTIKQVGNALTGTVMYDPSTLPNGFANPSHDLYGTILEAGNAWMARMSTPDGNLTFEDPLQFTFCPKPIGGVPCKVGVKRLRPASPSPSPRR
jgi:hypothetical protein